MLSKCHTSFSRNRKAIVVKCITVVLVLFAVESSIVVAFLLSLDYLLPSTEQNFLFESDSNIASSLKFPGAGAKPVLFVESERGILDTGGRLSIVLSLVRSSASWFYIASDTPFANRASHWRKKSATVDRRNSRFYHF